MERQAGDGDVLIRPRFRWGACSRLCLPPTWLLTQALQQGEHTGGQRVSEIWLPTGKGAEVGLGVGAGFPGWHLGKAVSTRAPW